MERTMRSKRRKAAWLLALAAVWACGSLIWSLSHPRPVQAQAEGLVMIVNKANTAAVGMNLAEAKKLLLGEQTGWRNGAKVLVVLGPAGSAERGAVLKKVCGMTESAYTRYEMQASFTGATAATVKEAASDAVVKSVIKANPGALGFIHKGAADDTVTVAMALD